MAIGHPTGKYGNYDPATKDWLRVEFNKGKPVQSAELNDLQLIQDAQREALASSLYRDGTYIKKVTFSSTLSDNVLTVSIPAGKLYALGFFHNVPAGTVELTGVGTESIYLKITKENITADDDADLLNPASGTQDEGGKGADRLQCTYEFVTDDTGILLATYQDGQLVLEPSSVSTIIEEMLAIMALREKEKDGSFLTTRPKVTAYDFKELALNPQSIGLEIDGGVGRIKGYRFVNAGKRSISVMRPLDSLLRDNEPEAFHTGTLVYNLDNTPIKKVTEVVAILESPTIDLARGQSTGGQDAIPSQYQPVESIVSVSQSPHGAYTATTDFVQSGNYVDWSPGGSEPATGTTYQVVVRYTKTLTLGVRTTTTVTGETKTVSSAACTLSHGEVKEILTVYNTSTPSTVYEEGTDFTVDKLTGDMTWLVDPGEGTGVTVDYIYWAHTLEGDYVARNSFVNSAGDLVLYDLPTKTPSDEDVDFTENISFDVSGGSAPVDGTNFYMEYEYVLSRKDALVWTDKGLFKVVKGVPGVNPKLPFLSEDYLPIMQLHLPPEAVAADITFESYDNLTLKVVDLRALQNTVDNILYNQAQFQLYINAESIPTATDKRGIFADDLATPDLADVSHPDFAGTFDPLARCFMLPRTSESSQPTLTCATASVKRDVWFPTYTEVTGVSQPFSSTSIIVNAYDSVNLRGKLSLNKNVNSKLDEDLALIRTVHDDTQANGLWFTNSDFLSNLSSKSNLANKIGESDVTVDTGVAWNGYAWWQAYVKINPEWVDVLSEAEQDITLNRLSTPVNSDVIFDGQWATVSRASQVVVKGGSAGGTVSISGQYFTPNEAAIQLVFGDRKLALTPTGATSAEPSANYPGTVVADANGEWTAQFTIPSGVKPGRYQVLVMGRDPADKSKIKTYASTYYQAVANLEYYGLYVQVHDNVWDKFEWYVLPQAFREALGLSNEGGYWNTQYPNITSYVESDLDELYATQWQPVAYTVATGIKEAVLGGVTLTEEDLAAAIAVMLAFSGLEPIISVDHINAWVEVVNLSSIDVEANAQAMMNVSAYAKLSLADFPRSYNDPLGQTFTNSVTRCLNSINLYFQVAPVSDSVTVTVVETDNGYPTNKVLEEVTLPASSINDNGAKTTFTFEKPVLLKAGVDYAFVVATADTAATLRAAVVGQTDTVNGLIVKNPVSGALFKSPNAKAWELIGDTDLKFDLNFCKFTNTQTILTTGAISFSTARSRFSFYTPFFEPFAGTSFVYQYSLNQTQWTDFAPMVEVDLGQAVNTLYIRIILNHPDSNAIPMIWDDANITGYIFVSPGAYVNRQYDHQSAEIRYADLWLHTDIPGGCTVTPYVDLDEEGFNAMSEVVADQKTIDLTWLERHFTYDTGGDLKQSVRVKIVLTSSAVHNTPRIRKIRIITREA